MTVSSDALARLDHARAFIDAHLDADIDLERIASHAGYSRYHFLRLFHRAYGQTPHAYLAERRIEHAKRLLAEGRMTVTDVCLAVGFQSPGSFSALFAREVGQPPALFRAHALQARNAPRAFVPLCFLIMSSFGEDERNIREAPAKQTF
jgi:AraC-like DNA-binding protein